MPRTRHGLIPMRAAIRVVAERSRLAAEAGKGAGEVRPQSFQEQEEARLVG